MAYILNYFNDKEKLRNNIIEICVCNTKTEQMLKFRFCFFENEHNLDKVKTLVPWWTGHRVAPNDPHLCKVPSAEPVTSF